jgi:hypothetical protein
MGIMAHRLTTEQLDFVVMHELGPIRKGQTPPRRAAVVRRVAP